MNATRKEPKMISITRAALPALAVLALLGTAWAGSTSSSSSSSSSSSRSSAPSSSSTSRPSSPSSSGGFSAPRPSAPAASSGGFTRPAAPPAAAAPAAAAPIAPAPRVISTPPAAPTSSGGFSSTPRPNTSVPIVPSQTPKASAYDTHVNREASSKAFEARQTPASKAAVGDKTFTPREVQEKRTVYVNTVYRDRYIPPSTGSSYGSFSDVFMGAMMYNALFAHNRSDDPEYRRWRRDADERALTDQKMKDQLADLDRKVKDLEGTLKDPQFLPADVPAEVIFADDALIAPKKTGHPIFLFLSILIGAVTIGAVVVMVSNRRRFA